MSTVERPILRSLYATVLRASERLPFPPQTDDEPLADTGESEKVRVRFHIIHNART